MKNTGFLALLPVLLLMGSTPLQARLGESPVRLEARFGVPVKIQNGRCARDFQCTYKHAGIIIIVNFLDERSQDESYSNESGTPLDTDEIQHLLGVNRRIGSWKLTQDTASSKKWSLDSGEASAAYEDQPGHALEIKTSYWEHYVATYPAEAKDGVKEQLKDF